METGSLFMFIYRVIKARQYGKHLKPEQWNTTSKPHANASSSHAHVSLSSSAETPAPHAKAPDAFIGGFLAYSSSKAPVYSW
jgi:hypothetical protein